MNEVHAVAGISKQALQKAAVREGKAYKSAQQILEQADLIRKLHPGVGCRKLAEALSRTGWGRDKTEALLLANGYRITYRPNAIRTTHAQAQWLIPNLIEGMELTNINQVVQTDITYYRIKDRFYYVVFVIDVYSRRIVGHSISKNLAATNNVLAIERMLQTRSGHCLKGLIHHSDRGSQFTDKDYCGLLTKHGIVSSMCREAWQNAYTERLNQTIKREYLDHWVLNDFRTLSRKLNDAVSHYNTKRKHSSLKKRPPIQFEQEVQQIAMELRPIQKIYLHSDNRQQQDKARQ